MDEKKSLILLQESRYDYIVHVTTIILLTFHGLECKLDYGCCASIVRINITHNPFG